MPFEYTEVAPTDITLGDSTDLFTNIDPAPTANCQIETCTVMDKDCKSPATFPGLKMTNSAPFQLSRDTLQVHGFNYDVCIKCNNG